MFFVTSIHLHDSCGLHEKMTDGLSCMPSNKRIEKTMEETPVSQNTLNTGWIANSSVTICAAVVVGQGAVV